MPGGALIGRAEIMDVLDFDAARKGRSKVLHQGTFTANPVSMAAGLAVLRELERIAGCARANILGALARRRLNELAAYEGLPPGTASFPRSTSSFADRLSTLPTTRTAPGTSTSPARSR